MKIFLSHASEDRTVAEEAQLALVAGGHDVFFDDQSLRASDDYHSRIRDEVKSRELFVFLISPCSVKPGCYTLAELKYAQRKWSSPKGRVLPVMIAPTPWEEVPTYLKAVTVLQPKGNVAAEIAEQVDLIAQELENRTKVSEWNSGGYGWLKQIKEVAIVFVPKQLRELVEKKLIRAMLLLILSFVILPPLIVLLSAFWLNQLENMNSKFINSLRAQYLNLIYDGFSIEELASRSHDRLDYFQFFEFELRPKLSSKIIRISIQQGQKAAIDFRSITLKADSSTCSVPEEEIQILNVFLGEQLIGTLSSYDSNKTFDIGKRWWKQNADKFEPEQLVQPLCFKLTDQIKQLNCGFIHIDGSLRVFKNILTTSK